MKGEINTIEEARSFDKKNNYEEATFMVYGEDASCGGMHDRPNVPFLGHYEGTAENTFKFGMTFKNWKSWGRGGYIKQYIAPKITKVDENSIGIKVKKQQELEELKLKQAKLQKEIDAIENN